MPRPSATSQSARPALHPRAHPHRRADGGIVGYGEFVRRDVSRMNEAGARETVASAYAKELSAYANGTLAKDPSLGTVYSLVDDSILRLPPSHLGIHTSDTALLATSFLLAILGSTQGDGGRGGCWGSYDALSNPIKDVLANFSNPAIIHSVYDIVRVAVQQDSSSSRFNGPGSTSTSLRGLSDDQSSIDGGSAHDHGGGRPSGVGGSKYAMPPEQLHLFAPA
ncbi:hypothetical protein C8J56DRAFT_1175402 [Mycena floridula]|nr:hypothetical protein C8J56DRAFT_1175402 [Mycena floridula]